AGAAEVKLHPFKPRSISGDPREIAAHWATREEDGPLGPEDIEARDAWLAEHPDHVEAYDATGRAMSRLERHAADPRILALRDAALSVKPERQGSPWRVAAAFLAAVVLAGGGLAAVSTDDPVSVVMARVSPFINPDAAVYRTVVG